MEFFLNNQATFWLGLGFLLLIIELVAFGMGSGVLLFGSIGALITGTLVWIGVVPDSFIPAVACFAISTAAATALLWQPLKKLQSGAELGNDRSSDLIGHTFTLGGNLSRTVHTQQKYSGIQWRVELAQELPDQTVAAGTPVRVEAVKVGVFYVAPFKS